MTNIKRKSRNKSEGTNFTSKTPPYVHFYPATILYGLIFRYSPFKKGIMWRLERGDEMEPTLQCAMFLGRGAQCSRMGVVFHSL